MRSDKELLAIQNRVVSDNEGVDFLCVGDFGLTAEEIAYIRSIADNLRQSGN
jgi:hypothetical protein